MIRSKTVVVLESNEAYLSEWKSILDGHEQWDVVYLGGDGEEGIRQIRLLKPDLVISSECLKGGDVFDVLRTIWAEGLRTRTIVTGKPSYTMLGKEIDEGVCCYLKRPFSRQRAIEAIENALSGCENFVARREYLKAMQGRIGNVLMEMRIGPHIKGYTYMRDLILYTVERRSGVNKIMELYVKIAERYGTKWENVEKALRHAIEVAWKNGLKESVKKIFAGVPCCWEKKPKVKEFVAFVSDNLALEDIA